MQHRNIALASTTALLSALASATACSPVGTIDVPTIDEQPDAGVRGGSSGNGTNGTGGTGIGDSGAGSANDGASGSGGPLGGKEGMFPTLNPRLNLPVPAAPAPCPAGSMIAKTSSPSLYAWPGAVFSTSALTGQGENHAPAKLQVQVTKNGQPVPNCEVRFRAADGNGWGFGSSKVTDQQGRLYGYWTAGQPGNGTISAVIALDGGGESKVDFTGAVADHRSRTNSVHLNYQVDGSYTEFKIRITPLSAPPATYYSALNWQDAYTGIQFDGNTTMVIFSVWDAGGEKAKISDPGACNAQVDFGGEGTGTSCRFKLPPSKNGAVAGLPDDYHLEVGNTYELYLAMKSSPSGGTAHTVSFSDLTRGLGPISLGTQTTGTAFHGGKYASGFVEEWVDHGSCLSNSRSVLYHGLRAKIGGVWQDVKTGTFTPNYVSNNNEICGNYLATGIDNTFLMSSGGTQYVGRPYVPGDAAFKQPVNTIELP